MSEKEKRDYWSDCVLVFFCGGKGYGLTDTLQTICLGNEDDIKKFFETGGLSNELNHTQRQVLSQLQEYRKELVNEQSKSDIKRRNPIGSRPAGIIKHRTANLKSAPPAKRIALHKTK